MQCACVSVSVPVYIGVLAVQLSKEVVACRHIYLMDVLFVAECSVQCNA